MNKQIAWQYAKRTLALLLAVAISVNGWLNHGISVRAAETFTVELEGFTEVSEGTYSMEYSGNVLQTNSVNVTVKDSTDAKVDGATFTWEKDGAAVTEIKEAGEYICTAEKEGYSGKAILTVNPKELAIVWEGTTSFEYNGEVQVPTVKVGEWDITTESVDLPVALATNMADKTVGDYVATLTLADTNNYVLSGSETCNYSVAPKQLIVDWGTLAFTYDGTAKLPTVTVDGVNADAGTSVSVSLDGDDCSVKMTVPDITNVGTNYEVVLALEGADKDNYTLSATSNIYSVNAKDLNSSDIVVEGLDEKLSYIEAEVELSALKVLDGDKELVKDTDYTVTYSDNVAVSDSAKVTIEGIGNYTGTLNKTFSIVYNAETQSVEAELSGTQLEGCAEGWYSENDVKLTAPTGWEISTAQNGEWKPELTITASDEEKNTVTYYLRKITDSPTEAYISDAKTAEFYVDTTYPSITALEVSDADVWTQSKVITINVDGNAIQRVYYVIGENSPETDVALNETTGTVDVTDYADDNVGIVYKFSVVDNAGHVFTQSITVNKIDVTAPTIAVKEGTADVAGTVYTNEVKTFEIICEDIAGESGIDKTTLRVTKKVSDGAEVEISVTTDNKFTLDEADKDNTIVYKLNVSDIAGRAAREYTFTVVYDTTAPQVINKGLWDGLNEFTTVNDETATLWINSRNGDMTWQLEIFDSNGESQTGISDIASVVYKTSDSDEEKNAKLEDGKCVITIPDTDYKGEYQLFVKDNAGNESECVKQWIKVDRTGAKFWETSIDGSAGGTGEDQVAWYNAERLCLNVNVTDDGSALSGIKKVFATTNGALETSSVTEEQLKNATHVIACESAVGDLWEFEITDADFNTREYFFYALDNAGNVTKCDTTLSLKRDSQKPVVDDILVSYASSDLQNSISIDNVKNTGVQNASDIIKKLQGLVNNIFVKKDIIVTLYVPDAIGMDDEEKVFSGVDQIAVKYNEKTVESENINKVDGHHAYAQIGNAYESTENADKVYSIFEVTLKVPEGAEPKEITDKLTITSIKDFAGNENDKVAEVVITSDNMIIIDDVAPLLSKAEHTTVETDNGNYHFYNAGSNGAEAPVVNLEITETNFKGKVNESDANAVILVAPTYQNVTGFGTATISDWSFTNKIASATVTLPIQDNAEIEYQYTLGYHDPSGNLMTGASGITVSDAGIYTSDVYVVDTIAPVLTQFEIVSNGGNLLLEDGIYYAENLKDEDIQILITINDNVNYFNASNVIVQYSADGENWEELLLKEGDTWSTGTNNHSAIYYFDGTAEGEDTYQFRVAYKDRANNALVLPGDNKPAVNEADGGTYTSAQKVVIDHCLPKLVEMTFAEPVQMFDGDAVGVNGSVTSTITDANTKLYYDQNATVQFSITDKYLKAESVVVMMYQRAHKADEWKLYDGAFTVEQSELSGGKTYSFEIPSEETEYYFTVSYTDRAGNLLVYDNVATTDIKEAYENGIKENTDTYTAPVFVKDETAPAWTVAYNKEPVAHNSVESVKTVLTVTEKNIDLDKTLVKVSSKDINGEKIEAAGLSGFTYDDEKDLYIASWAELLEKTTTVPNYNNAADVQTLTLNLTTEANYKITVDVVDKVTKPTKYTNSYSIDRTTPSITIVTKDGKSYQDVVKVKSGLLDFDNSDITYSVINDGKFARIINKVTFGYFAKAKLVVHVKVHDTVSGVISLVPTCVNEGKEVENYTLSKQKAIKGDKSVVQYDITLPIDFKGTIKMHGIDNANNIAKDTGATGLIAETAKRHKELASNEIKVLTPYSKTPNYYAGNVKVKFTSVDGYSGFYKVNYQAGSYVETVSYTEGEKICLEVVKEHTISSKDNNENNIKFVLGFEDNAAHKATIAKADIPEVHIDTTAPKIDVVYDNMAAENEKYYKEPRTATVTITERNFDPTDTKLDITGPSAHISDWKHVAGSGCEGGADPKDTKHTDGCKWECQIKFSEDGDYTFTCSTIDLAGNSTDYGQTDEFVIDQTVPEIKVTYDNHDALNEFYYKEQRIATIEITEHNFDSADVITTMTAEIEGRSVRVPTVSNWSSNGDVHRATIAYDYDADFTFDIAYKDLAGNEASDYEQDKFTVDLTAPEIEIYDIEDFSANNDVVAPGIRYSDTNYDADGTEVLMSGYRNGTVEMTGVRRITANGVEFKLNDFERVPEMDDMYTMNAVVYDLAGNSSEASVMFSVNRFGSVYTFDEKTEALVGEEGSYYTDEEQEIVVTETNVDTLEFKEITLNLNGKLKTLVEGKDYDVSEDGSETSWKQYTYRIHKNNFEEEGTYILTIYSEDRATNTSDNNTKGKKIEFVVDKTEPSVVITGVEHEIQYREENREVTLDVEDSVRIGQLSVILNGETKVYTAAEVIEMNGKITFTIGSLNKWQTLKVIIQDAAGNETETNEMMFLITPNVFVQFYMNKPIFFGTLGAIGLLGGGLWFVLTKRKRDKEESK